jgi:hypothetical protein
MAAAGAESAPAPPRGMTVRVVFIRPDYKESKSQNQDKGEN